MTKCIRNIPIVFILLLLVFVHGHAVAESTLDRIQERGQLVLGTSGNMPAMSQVDVNGKVTGFDIDIARLMANGMGVELIIRVVPFGDLLSALESGEVDVVISNFTMTLERNLRVAFVGPYLESGKCIISKNRALAGAEQTKDLNTSATRLAVLIGSTSEDFTRELFPQVTIVNVDAYPKAVAMVKDDLVDGMLTDFPICLSILKKNPEAGFESLFSVLTYEPIGIALPRDDAQFINWTQNFLQRLDGTDAIKGLNKRWFGKIKLGRKPVERTGLY